MRPPFLLVLAALLAAAPALAQAPGTFADVSSGRGGPPLPGHVTASAVGPDGAVYAGGSFPRPGGTGVDGVARWDGDRWTVLLGGTGPYDGWVRRLAFGPDGSLYAAGTFDEIGGVRLPGIVRWDGTAWHPLGSGVAGEVLALAFGPDGSLVAGGRFAEAGGVRVHNVARWDGAAWSALGSPDSTALWPETVNALAFAPDGALYAAGQVNGTHSTITRWDGAAATVQRLGGAVRALAVGPDGTLTIAGHLGYPGCQTSPCLAGVLRWTGTAWARLGAGIPGAYWLSANALAVDASGAILVASQNSVSSAVPYTHDVWRFSGTWERLPATSSAGVYSLTVASDGSVLAGGSFTALGPTVASRLARWDGQAWQRFGSAFNGPVQSLAVGADGSVVATGSFTSAGDTLARGVARRTGGAWAPLGSSPYGVGSVVAHPDGSLFATAVFARPGAASTRGVARWDGAAWAEVGAGPAGPPDPEAAAVALGPNGDLYAVGRFDAIGGVPAANVARWDGAAWHALGGGISGTARRVAVATDGAVYVAGDFVPTPGGWWLPGVMRWDGTRWTLLPDAPFDTVWNLAARPGGGIYATGFYPIGVAEWTGAAWRGLGEGWGSADGFSALAVGPAGDLYVGGRIAQAGGQPARNLARWDGAAWQPVPDGPAGEVRALAFTPEGRLYVGGDFAAAGGQLSPFVTLYTPTALVGSAPPPAEPAAVSLSVGPNPARGTATAWIDTEVHATVTVHDALGRRVATAFEGFGPTAVPLPVAGLAPGVYVVRLATGGAVRTARLVVAR